MRDQAPVTQAAPASGRTVTRRRRGFLRTYLTPKQAIPREARLTLGIGSFIVILLLWTLGSGLIDNPLFLPNPAAEVIAWIGLVTDSV